MDEMELQDGKRSMVKWVMNMPNWSVLGTLIEFIVVKGNVLRVRI
ncbi:hypothetical protein HanRHA438_Chr05g0209191 [Helianthus annuus]|uniref:Uncharacterized protein n=1 Tax=Helianthus annuus TaxID=4232 RepID=A0A9K3IWY8_HELAN|nr:hypothetical protein HanXRQr2_Chr05g0199471 [Helianthus annuus]KAJ0569227.1 hypothetical protein HanHA300_Chr05g0163691 [Helianthus annuus]KAJ0583536.1 hypothetical protein HanHA89_Chr05g0177731 [Helianthus annuus]KAJ0746266.1 hypothetical protein HanOQP8_Chr05g0175581 [Helianthus annuus]KAJ0917719.1 hypothetical protein HanRHA438_Chr05g0209191 [Helianthus annuus]